MSEFISYDEKLICDNCGKKGAFDFIGDYFCSDCATGCKRCETVFIQDLKKPRQKYCPD